MPVKATVLYWFPIICSFKVMFQPLLTAMAEQVAHHYATIG